MQQAEYHKKIVDYYLTTENAYKDSWDLDNSLAIHYGYWDEKVNSFSRSLLRMNEVMMDTAGIQPGDQVLDAGCGVGGSSIFLALQKGSQVTGITLSPKQAALGKRNAQQRGVEALVGFRVMDYCATSFPDASFDVVWGCESICYAEDKERFVKEAFRLLRPGGRLVVADGFVSQRGHNNHPIIRQWLDGWAVNYLETPDQFGQYMKNAGFAGVDYRDISAYTFRSARRLYRIYYLASLYLAWKKITFSSRVTDVQKGNIKACRFQYLGLKKHLWEYGLIVGRKP